MIDFKLMRERHQFAIDFERENREEAIDDLRFRAGDQWPTGVKSEREATNRPCLTINRMPQFVRQVTGDIRQNKPGIKVHPVDSGSDPAIARVFTGLIRHIEAISDATHVYAKAADASATCGQGFFRIVTDYQDEESFDQEIFVQHIRDPLSVLFDPNAVKPSREDAAWCFVTSEIGLEEFKQAWPKAAVADFESQSPSLHVENWFTKDKVRIAEYWVKEPVNKTIALTADGAILDVTNVDRTVLEQMQVKSTRKVGSHKIVQHVVTGLEELESSDWPGVYFPIIPVWGEEVHVGEKVVRHGLVRFAKDPQRMYNYHRSAGVEVIALQPKAPFIGTEKQFKNNAKIWERANQDGVPYLPYTPDPLAPGLRPERQPPPAFPAAMYQEAAVAADDMKAVTGIFDASLGAEGNETSGKAILARQKEGDVGTFVYMDNLALAIRHAGRVLVNLIPKVYDTERTVRILGEDDSEDFAVINQRIPTGEGFKTVNDLSLGRYDVVVSTGPSYSTKRMEAADSMVAFINAAPQTASMVMDLLAKNLDWPGADEIAARFRKVAVAQGLAEPEEGDAPPQPQPPPPGEIAKLATAEAKAMEAEAKSQKAEAETESIQLDNIAKAIEISLMSGNLKEAMSAIAQQAASEVIQGLAQQGQPPQPEQPGI